MSKQDIANYFYPQTLKYSCNIWKFHKFCLTLPTKEESDMDKINISKEKINSELAIFLFKEDDNYIAYSPALDLSGYGKTEEEARNSFNIVLKEYFDYCINISSSL